MVRNCDGNPEKLRSGLLSIPEHYSNRHQLCPETSRCRVDPKYEPSRITITDPKAYAMLTNVIKSCTLFKHPQDFCLGKDSYTVESFDNVMNVFQDKRISFSDGQYLVRSQLATCHWNENVDRAYTSVWHPKNNPRAPRSIKGKKSYAACTFNYRKSIWDRHMKIPDRYCEKNTLESGTSPVHEV